MWISFVTRLAGRAWEWGYMWTSSESRTEGLSYSIVCTRPVSSISWLLTVDTYKQSLTNQWAIYIYALLTVCFSTNQRAITFMHCWLSVFQPIRALLHFLHCCSANQRAITLLHCWQSVFQPIRELLHFCTVVQPIRELIHFLHCCSANQRAITHSALFTCTRKTCCNTIWHLLHFCWSCGLWYSHM